MYIEEAQEAGRILALAKVAKAQTNASDDMKDVRDLGLGAAGLGAAGMAIAPAKERITGRKILYHGTTPEMAAKIRQGGLKPAAATGVEGVTEYVLGKEVASKPLVYAHPDKAQAQFYQEQAKAIAGGGREGFKKFRQKLMTDPFAMSGVGDKGVVRMEIPHGAAKYVENPETAGGLLKNMSKGLDPATYYDLAHRTKTIEGGVDAKHIRGGTGFKNLSLKEVTDYAKANPGRFAAGTGLALGGALAAGFGAKKLRDVYKRNTAKAEEKEQQKAASKNWRDYVTEEEGEDYDNAIRRTRSRAAAAGAGGAVLGGVAGHAGKKLNVPFANEASGALLGTALGLKANQKSFSKDDLKEARKIMLKGGRAKGKERFEARMARELKKRDAA